MELISINKVINAIRIFLYPQPIYYYYQKLSIKQNTVLIESTITKNEGHLLHIIKELDKKHPGLDIYLADKDVKLTKKNLEQYDLKRVNLVRYMSRKYFKLLATAEYLINDTIFCPFFIKNKGQKYLSFWHETSLNNLGLEIKSMTDVANIQRNFYTTDKIIVNNELFVNRLVETYGLNGIYQGKIVVAPLDDSLNGAQIVCDYLFKRITHKMLKELNLYNNKETAFFLSGGFWDNGVTTAILNTFDNIDLDKRNYVVLLGQKQLKKEHEFRVKNLSHKIIFYPFPESLNANVLDQLLYLAYMRLEWFDHAWIRKRVATVVQNDYNRIVGDLKVDHFVQFTGFGNRYSELTKHVPKEVNTVMYVHTDMIAEYKAKKSFSKKIIFSTYEKVNKVAVVHENLKEGLILAVPTIREKIYIMNNFLGEERIRDHAKANLLETLTDVEIHHGNKDYFLSDLNNKSISTFINIGRFDYQKGHDRLIKAFEIIHKENRDTILVVVAPHGPLRKQTISLAENSIASSGIYILGRMSNPYTLLSKCDCFVLSSHYEGLGLVVYEALAVGISCVTVNLKETTAYLKNNEAIIAHNSVGGIEEGMRKYLSRHPVNKFDFSVPKEKSLLEFESLFKK